MSICVISLPDPDRALIAVDTLVQIDGLDRLPEGQKLHLLPHCGIALAGVGAGSVPDEAFRRIARPGFGIDFDMAADAMASMLGRVMRGETEQACEAYAKVLRGGNILYLVGWSARAGAMQARAYLNAAGSLDFTDHLIPRFTAQPRPEGDLRAPETLEELEAMARAAVAAGRAMDPAGPYGGRLVLAEITRDGMRSLRKQLV